MDPLLHAISLVSASAAGVLFSAVWEGAVLAACVALCLRLLPGLSAAARSVVWSNVFLLLVLLHVLPSIGARGFAGSGYHPSPFLLDPLWAVAIAGAWAMLSLWRGAHLVAGAMRGHGLAARATPMRADAALQALLQVRQGGKLGRKAELCTSLEIERPSVFGFFHPRILLPSGLPEQLSASQLRQVVIHEMEHLRRADDWTNLLQKVGLVLFPLNPALLWVERRLCAERELACDDRVLHSTGARKAYAICLTRLAEYSIFRRNLSLALGAWERRSELVRRIQRILRHPEKPIGGKRGAVLTGGLIFAVLAGAAALACSPQLLSFAPPAQPAMQARAIPASGLQQIGLREFSGSPELVKAVLPQKRPQTAYGSAHRRSAVKRTVRWLRPLPSQTAWFVLTEWHDYGPPSRVLIAVSQDQRSSYAAVAIADGWLIVQI
jgi:hypothetical protein